MRKAIDPCASSSSPLTRVLLLTATILAATFSVPEIACAARPTHAAPAPRHVVVTTHQPSKAAAPKAAESKAAKPHQAAAAKAAPRSAEKRSVEKVVSRSSQPQKSSSRNATGFESANIHHIVFSKPSSASDRRSVHESKAATRGSVHLKKTPERNLALGRGNSKSGKARVYASRSEVLQCVPFARAASGIELKGNAVNWWDAASGVYERGHRPESGAVLNFRANSSMRLGHVAVVKHIINSREIEIDHANWAWSGKSNVTRNVAVIDVSERNDWTAVRVALGGGRDDFGSVYATYGFIYDRPDHGTMIANSVHPRSLVFSHGGHSDDEVAEAPRGALNFGDAPGRSLR